MATLGDCSSPFLKIIVTAFCIWREDKERANKTQWSERADSMDHLELKMKASSSKLKSDVLLKGNCQVNARCSNILFSGVEILSGVLSEIYKQ